MKKNWLTHNKHFWQPFEKNAARKAHTDLGEYVESFNTVILLHPANEYSIFDGAIDGIILVCADGTVVDQL